MICRPSVWIALLLLVGCSGSTAPSVESESQALDMSPKSARPTSQLREKIVRRTLDFEDPTQLGDVIERIEYGSSSSELGYLGVCRGSSCARPCPCSAPLQPSAFDIDARNRYWLLDVAKDRVAVFSEGRFLFDVPLRGRGYRSFDVQARSSEEAVVLRHRGDLTTEFLRVVKNSRPNSVRLRYRGRYVDSDSVFSIVDESAFLSVFDDARGGKEIPVQVPLDSSGVARARAVPGRPFLDGWYLFRRNRGELKLPIAVSSSAESWKRLIVFRLRRDNQETRGGVSWEVEVAPVGTIHLLLFLGTYGRRQVDGYWYLGISAEGKVGRPIPLTGPSRRDDQQMRRLTLLPDGSPFAMWADKRGVRVESLEDISKKSISSSS